MKTSSVYRPEITGLRTIAVLPVILFHAGFSFFDGGFVGVDVFFVISGYLITGIIRDRHNDRSFSLATFYKARCIRILPALAVVLAASWIAAILWMTPDDFESFSKSLISVATFSSNQWFLSDTSYFDVKAEFKPLLHTWSLAVEEQYYLAFPILFAVVWKISPRWILPSVVLVGAASFVASDHLVRRGGEEAYFLLASRAWEILVGSAAALTADHIRRVKIQDHHAHLLAVVGFVALCWAMFSYSANTPFPGRHAVVPVLGTAAIILFLKPGMLLQKVLAWRPLEVLGAASYSIYLWHQPILAFARLRSLDALTELERGGLVLASIALGLGTWLFVEMPARRLKSAPTRFVGWASSLACAVAIALGVPGVLSEGLPDRFPPMVIAALQENGPGDAPNCFLSTSLVPAECVFGDHSSVRTIALFGDSHAQALLRSLDKAFKLSGIRGVRVNIYGCEPIPSITVSGLPTDLYDECARKFDRTIANLKSQVSGVVVSVRWTYRMYPIPGLIDHLTFDNGEGGIEFDKERTYEVRSIDGAIGNSSDLKRGAVERMFKQLSSLEVPIALIHAVPEVGWDIRRYNFIFYLNSGEIPAEITTSYERFRQRQKFTESVLDELPDSNIVHIRPADKLCDQSLIGRCLVQSGGHHYYSDDDHLSSEGVELLMSDILSPFRLWAEARP